MDFLSSLKNREEVLSFLNVAIDRIYKKETTKKITSDEDFAFVSKVISEFCSNQLTKTELLEYFLVADELKECIFKTIELRKPQICAHLVKLHNSANIPLMLHFDWDLKFIIGNSSLSSVREQKATLILSCQKDNGPENLSVELSRKMLDKFILELEKQQNS